MRLADHDAFIRAAVKCWHNGDMTFEQMAVYVIRELAAQRDKYLSMARIDLQRSTEIKIPPEDKKNGPV